MEKKRIKRIIILLTTYFTIILTVKAGTINDKNELYPYNTNPTESIDPYASYSRGDVYIADKDTIKKIIVDSKDIYIIDERDQDDPNMCICNSYKITSSEEIDEILNIILKYEEENPSPWDRSKDSLYNEWVMHNIGFNLGIRRFRTRNVDLDNNDEENYNSEVLTRILK